MSKNCSIATNHLEAKSKALAPHQIQKKALKHQTNPHGKQVILWHIWSFFYTDQHHSIPFRIAFAHGGIAILQ
jgi:competence protein ComGF